MSFSRVLRPALLWLPRRTPGIVRCFSTGADGAAGGAGELIATRAAILRQRGLPRPYTTSKPLSIETVYLQPPGEVIACMLVIGYVSYILALFQGEVLVDIKAAGLCHSDLSVI